MPPKIPIDRLALLHQALKSRNFDVPDDVETFRANLKDRTKSDQLHAALVKRNFDVPESTDQFYSNLFEKKNLVEPTSPPGSDQSQIGSTHGGANPEQLARLEGTYGKSPAPFVPGAINQTIPNGLYPGDEEAVKSSVTGDNGVNLANSIAGSFDREFVKTLITGIPKTIAVGVNWATGGNVEDDVLYKAAKWVDNFTDEIAPVNPAHGDDDLVKLASGAGVIGAYIMGGGLGRTSRVADLAIPTAKKAVMENLANNLPGAFLASANTASNEYENALAKTGSQNIAKEAWSKGLLSGVPFLVSPTLNYFEKYTGGRVTTSLVEGAKGGADLMFQMGMSTAITNMGAKETYDYTRKLMDGVFEAGGSGFALGALMNGVIAAITHSPILTPHDKFEIINSVKEKQKMLSDNNIRASDYFKTKNGKPTQPIEMVNQGGIWVQKGDLGKTQNKPNEKTETSQKQITPKEMGEYSPKKVVTNEVITKPQENEGSTVPSQTQRPTDITSGEKPGDIKVDQETPALATGAGGVNKGTDLIKGTYVEPHVTRDPAGNYVFFHVSPAEESSVMKGIESTKYNSTHTSRNEKGLQYGVASYYTKPGDSERMVGGDKYMVTLKPSEVYPIDSDPNGYRKKAEVDVPGKTPFRTEMIKKNIADQAKEDGYKMIVGEWNYDRSGSKKENAMRADALVPLLPTKVTGNENLITNDNLNIPHPDQNKILLDRKISGVMDEVETYKSGKNKYDQTYSTAKDIRVYGGIRENAGEDNETIRDVTGQDLLSLVGLPKKLQVKIDEVIAQINGKQDVVKSAGNESFTKPEQTELVNTQSGIKPSAETPIIPDQVQAGQKAGQGVQIGNKVDFLWLDAEKTGVIVSITPEGKYKIRSGKTVYPVRENDLITDTPPKFSDNIKDLNSDITNLPKKYIRKARPSPGTLNASIGIEVLKLIRGGYDMLNRAQDATSGKFFRNIEEIAAKQANIGVSSRYIAVRAMSEFLRNIIGGLPYHAVDLESKLTFTGMKNEAYLLPKMWADEGYNIIGKNLRDLARVHAALDNKPYENDPNLKGMTYDKLGISEKALYDNIRLANDYIHEWAHDNKLITDETYKENKGKYIARMYEEFVMPDDLKNNMSTGRADFSMFIHRKDNVDKEILRDPVYATAKRMSQIAQMKAIFAYANVLIKNGKIKVSDTEFPGSVQLGEPGDKPFYGSLTGKFVPQYIAEDFKGFFYTTKGIQDIYSSFKSYDSWWLRQFLKKSHTVFNPVVQLGNATNNYVFAFLNGIDPVTFTANLIATHHDVSTKSGLYLKMIHRGRIGTDISSGDIRPAQDVRSGIGQFEGWIMSQGDKGNLSPATTKVLGKVARAYDKFNKVSSRLYSSVDDYAKVAAFKSFLDQNYTEEQALGKMYEGFQNYSTVGKFYDFSSKTPIIGPPYIKFKPDMARIIKNAATRRPLNTLAFLGGLMYIGGLLSRNSGEDEDIKKAREGRSFIPKIRPTPFGDIPLVWQVPNVGEVNVNRFMSPYYFYDRPSGWLSDVTSFLPYQLDVRPSVASKDPHAWPAYPDVFLGTIAQAAEDVDFRNKSIWDPLGTKDRSVGTDVEKIWNGINYVARSWIPFFNNSMDFYAAFHGNEDFYNRQRSVGQALLNNIIKVQEFSDPQVRTYLEREINYRVNKITDLERDISFVSDIYEKSVQRINENEGRSTDAKSKAMEREMVIFNKRVAEKNEKIAQLVKELENPTKLKDDLIKKFGWKIDLETNKVK